MFHEIVQGRRLRANAKLKHLFIHIVLLFVAPYRTWLNCRIPCHFEAAPRKRLDTRIRSRKYHSSPSKLLSILWSGYADTQWKTWIPGYVDTRTSHMGTGYQLRVTCFKMLCSICMDMWIRGYAVENTSCIVSVIRPKHSRKILAFILRFG